MPSVQSSRPHIFTTPPPQPAVEKPGQLSEEEVKRFFEEGFLLVPEFFTNEELQPVIDATEKLLDELTEKLFKAGKIKDKYEGATCYSRLTLIEKEFPGAAVLLMKNGILPKAYQDLWTNERLLNVAEQMIGPEIAGHPVWNLRAKTPRNEQVTVPWHQDNAYLSAETSEVFTATAWIPLLDAKQINGCMEVARGGHRKGLLATHTCCAGPTWYVELDEQEMDKSLGVKLEEDVVLCEVPFGGVLFLNNLIPHRSKQLFRLPTKEEDKTGCPFLLLLENFSDKIRWSLDLRWHRPDEPNGFYGLKDSILFRTSKDPNYKVNWDVFALLDRTKLQEKHADENDMAVNKDSEDPEFDTTIVGPWMNNWEIVHHNKHTKKHQESGKDETSWHKA